MVLYHRDYDILFYSIDPICHASHRPVHYAGANYRMPFIGNLVVELPINGLHPVVMIFLYDAIQLLYRHDALVALFAWITGQ